MNNLYIAHKIGDTYPTNQPMSFPFPPNNIPEPIYSNNFLIEFSINLGYLRHIENPYFCRPILNYGICKDQGEPSEDPSKNTTIIYYVYFDAKPFTVGYKCETEARFFLHTDFVNAIDYLDFYLEKQDLLKLYEAADLSTLEKLNEAEIQGNINRAKQYLQDNNLSPKGIWEAQVFGDNFGNNPFILSDDEFEMIFGVER